MKKLVLIVCLFSFSAFSQVDLSLDSALHRTGVGGYYSNGLDYTEVTWDVINDINVYSFISNNGVDTAFNTYLKVEAWQNNTLYNELYSDSINLCGSCSDTFKIVQTYTPFQWNGEIEFRYFVFSDAVETNILNNTDTIEILIKPGYMDPYRRDNGSITDTISQAISGPTNLPAMFGNVYQMFNPFHFEFISFMVSGDISNAGQLVYGTVFRLDTVLNTWEYVTQTGDYTLSASDLNQIVELHIYDCVSIDANDYFLVTIGHYGGPNPVKFLQAQRVEENSVLSFSNSSIADTVANHKAILVYPLMDCYGGVHEEQRFDEFNFQIYPQPAKSNVQLKFLLSEPETVSVYILDISGKILETENYGSQTSGEQTIYLDVEQFDAGIFFVQLTVGDIQKTQRLVISK